MVLGLIFFISTLAAIFILSENPIIKIEYRTNLKIIISFILFDLIFTEGKTKPRKNKLALYKNGNIDLLYESARYILRHSNVEILRLNIPISIRDPAMQAINLGAISSVIYSLYAFLIENSKFFNADKIIFDHSVDNNNILSLNASITAPFISITLATIKFGLIALFRKVTKIYVRK